MTTVSLPYVTSVVSDVLDITRDYIERGHPVALDVETTGLDPRSSRLVSIQLKQFGYPPVILDVRSWGEDDWEFAREAFQSLFDTCRIVGMNFSFDWQQVFHHTGLMMPCVYDIMLAEQVFAGKGGDEEEEEETRSYKLKDIAARYHLEVSKDEQKKFIDMDQRPEEWNAPFRPEQIEYMSQDVEVLEPIAKRQKEIAQKLKVMRIVNLENRALPAVAWMEHAGIHIEQAGWEGFIQEKAELAEQFYAKCVEVFGEAIAKVRAEKYRQLVDEQQDYIQSRDAYVLSLKEQHALGGTGMKWGDYKKKMMAEWRETHPTFPSAKVKAAKDALSSPINLSSPKQLIAAFEYMNIPVTSTAAKELDKLPDGLYPELDLLKAWRSANTYVTRFGEKILSAVNPSTGRLYPSYRQIGADTGRMSCVNPPWQQIPAKGDGKRLRSYVTAEPGHVILTADFTNIEMSILADITRDATMLKLFAEGTDLHGYTARMMFNLGPEVDVKTQSPKWSTLTYREIAKKINFGLVYGMSASTLAVQLKTDKKKAQELLDAYFQLYSGVANWLETQKKMVLVRKASRTIWGRPRFYEFPDPSDPDYRRIRSSVQRQACNQPIQGTSADITKLALSLFFERAHDIPGVRLITCVHDELVVECPKELAEQTADILRDAMDDACREILKHVTVKRTTVNIGESWEKI